MPFYTFINTNYSTAAFEDHYLSLQVEPGKVFFVLWAWLYEQEYMDTVTKQRPPLVNITLFFIHLHTCTYAMSTNFRNSILNTNSDYT